MSGRPELIALAARRINAILRQLEAEAGLVVIGLGLDAIEVTTMDDAARRLHISARIEVALPNNRVWEVA